MDIVRGPTHECSIEPASIYSDSIVTGEILRAGRGIGLTFVTRHCHYNKPSSAFSRHLTELAKLLRRSTMLLRERNETRPSLLPASRILSSSGSGRCSIRFVQEVVEEIAERRSTGWRLHRSLPCQWVSLMLQRADCRQHNSTRRTQGCDGQRRHYGCCIAAAPFTSAWWPLFCWEHSQVLGVA